VFTGSMSVTGSVTATSFAGSGANLTSIPNAALSNSTISGIALGSNLATLTISTGLSGTSYNGSGAVTIANTGVTSNVAGTGISVSGATGAVTITNSGVTSIVAGTNISISGATGAVTITNGVTNNNQLTNGAGYITSAGNAATATAAQNATFLTQANATWGAKVQLGGNGAGSGVANIAVVQATDGNLHMDSGLGKSMYLNYYHNGIIYLNGSTYTISANGSQYNGNSATATTTTGNAGSVTYLPNRTDGAAYQVLWGAAYSNTIGTIAYSCAAVTITSSTGTLNATTFSGAGTGLTGTAASLSIGGTAASETLATVTNRGSSTSQNITFSNGRKGLIGVYDAAQTQAIFAMGAAYILTDGGASSTIGNLYGLAWSYNPGYGGAGNNPQSIAGLNHQLLHMQNGVTTAAIGSGIWTSGGITAGGTITAPTFSGALSGNATTATSISGYGNPTTASSANTIVYRDVNGYITNNYFYTSGGGAERNASGMGYFAGHNTGDYYIRSYTSAAVASLLGLGTAAYQSANQALNTSSSPTFSYVYLSVLAGTDYGALMYSNNGSSYTQWRIAGSKNGYGGISDGYSNAHIGMYDSSGNGGVYREVGGGWYWYYLVANACMGINTSTTSASYGLYVLGSIYTTGTLTQASDVRKKTDIVTIDNALEKVTQMRGVYFTKIGEEEKGRQTGVIAQEINEILPEVVIHAADVDEYSVAYGNVVGILIEGMKELNAKLEAANTQIENLKQLIK
jgi:hypothetical protein